MTAKQKNRFSNLLEHLMGVAELKNSILAGELQYDVSYISKWLGGQLPSAKTEKNVMQGISRCVVRKGSAAGRETLLNDYQVTSLDDLEGAIYDHLMAEYSYVRNTQKDTENAIAPKTLYFPKLDMRQYIFRMNHPVLRRVKSLDIMALMDLMAMDREFRLQIAHIESGSTSQQWQYPDVHFSMIIDLDTIQKDYVYDVVFLLNMLTDMTRIDFRLYGARNAYGRCIFTVKDEFSISAMLTQSQECMSVVVSEDAENANTIYGSIRALCSRERMLVRKITMTEMLRGNDYARSLISPNQRLLFGHLNEHFITNALLESITTGLAADYEPVINISQLQWLHALSKRRFEELPVQIMFYESALSEFAVMGELDFYNIKVKLTPVQRLDYICNLRDLLQHNENLSVKLIYGRLFSDFQYNANQCVFLTDGISYLSLDGNGARDSLYIINNRQMHDAFRCFYDEVWQNCREVVISDRAMVLSYIDHIIQQIRMIVHLDQ